MSIAWATILIVLLLLPGIAFLGGLSLFTRQSREIVRSNVIGDIAMAVGLAVAIHLLLLGIATAIAALAGLDLLRPVRAFAFYAIMPEGQVLDRAIAWLPIYLLYTLVISVLSGGFGIWVGRHRFVATHKWAYDLDIYRREQQNVIAYIVTNIKEGSRVLMYKGVLLDFYQEQNGTFAYVILGTCSRYFLDMDDTKAKTTPPKPLFSSIRPRVIDYFFVDGKNIANILFDTVDLDLDNIEQIIADQTQRPPPRPSRAKPRARPARARSTSTK
jgi:hypothetical protein